MSSVRVVTAVKWITGRSPVERDVMLVTVILMAHWHLNVTR
jgi:hypothetical protein